MGVAMMMGVAVLAGCVAVAGCVAQALTCMHAYRRVAWSGSSEHAQPKAAGMHRYCRPLFSSVHTRMTYKVPCTSADE